MGISYKPEDFVKGGGGPFPAGVYRFTESHFGPYQYENSQVRTFAFITTLINEAGDAMKEQAWSIGDVNAYTTDPDGKEIKPLGRRESLSDNCKFHDLVVSMGNSGYPTDQLNGNSAHDFDNLVAALDWIPDKPREGLVGSTTTRKTEDGREFAKTTLLPVQIVTLPWDYKDGAAAGPAGKAAGGAAKAAANPEAAKDKLVGLIVEMAGAGDVKLPTLKAKIFATFKEDPDRQEITRLASSEEFLDTLEEFGLERSGTIIKLA